MFSSAPIIHTTVQCSILIVPLIPLHAIVLFFFCRHMTLNCKALLFAFLYMSKGNNKQTNKQARMFPSISIKHWYKVRSN